MNVAVSFKVLVSEINRMQPGLRGQAVDVLQLVGVAALQDDSRNGSKINLSQRIAEAKLAHHVAGLGNLATTWLNDGALVVGQSLDRGGDHHVNAFLFHYFLLFTKIPAGSFANPS